MTDGMIVGIDASRNRSGGARAHLIGIISDGDPLKHGISQVHLWSFQSLLQDIPNPPWLIKHNPKPLEKSLVSQVWWQYFDLPREAKRLGCSIILNTDAGTVSRFRPSVTMSRDMLSYESGEIERFGIGTSRLRLMLLRYIQNRSLRSSTGAIFLSTHASTVIQRSCGAIPHSRHIPHGVSADFKRNHLSHAWPDATSHPISCLYVSNITLYKHQWIVVRAIGLLRQKGYNVTIKLVGECKGPGRELLTRAIAETDPHHSFTYVTGLVPQAELPSMLAASDLFIFASSCENMPNTLLEAMAVGLPIACSDRGPMPEILSDGGLYFDPEDADSIASAVEKIINDSALRARIARRAKALSEQYSWSRCADETWAFLVDVEALADKRVGNLP
jgi:glycosyltransferase involved in cell wall biosynthesis